MNLRFAIFALIFVIISCHMRDFRSEKPNDADTESVASLIQFYKDDRLIATFSVEIASTDEERQKGLMFRKSLKEDSGMIFLFNSEADHTFWMKNTYIPLDMIFIDSDMNVVGIFKNAVPLSEETISIGRASRYVLEINAGLSDKSGIDEKTRAVFINIF